MDKFIINPINGQKYKLNSTEGFEILKNYLENFVSQEGGMNTVKYPPVPSIVVKY